MRNTDCSIPILLKNTFLSFEELDIEYCHWKSNANLKNAFLSKSDFDLLVSYKDSQKLSRCLSKLGFKKIVSTQNFVYPGMEEFLGFDDQTGLLFHFHVHYKLIFGQKHYKNYHLPIEKLILSSAIKHETLPIKIICPELEFFLLIIRLLLKLTIDKRTVKRILISKFLIPKKLCDEYNYLVKQIDENVFANYCHLILPELKQLLLVFVAKSPTEFTSLTLFYYKMIIRNKLSSYRLFTRGALINEKFIRRLSLNNQRRWLTEGAISIAFIGIDGAGKSTSLKAIKKWLGKYLSVKTFYMGHPKNNLTWNLLNLVTRIFNRLRISMLYKYVRSLRGIYLARKKLKIYQTSVVLKNQGVISLFDRYPIRSFHKIGGIMDGPSLSEKLPFSSSEQSFYNKITDPDLVILLIVNPEESLKRKTEHKSQNKIIEIQKKYNSIRSLQMDDCNNFLVIDTSRTTREEILLKIKKTIWNHL